MVTLAEQKKTLQLTRRTGERYSLDLPPVDDKEIGCNVFFPSDSRYIAVALYRLPSQADSVHVAVADTSTGSWTSNFIVRADEKLGKPLSLLGFFENSSSLVVLGKPSPLQKHSFSTALIDIKGKQVAQTTLHTLADGTSVGNPNYADAKNNRMWFHSSPQPCPMQSVPLVGEGPSGTAVSEDEGQYVCDGGNLLAFPDENELAVASTKEPRDLVWRVDIKGHTGQQMELPATGRSYTQIGRIVLSPDGTVFAIERNLLSNSLFGDAHSSGTEVNLVQVKPLKLIGKVDLKTDADSMSISIDHRSGVVTVLNFIGSKWSSEQVKVE